MTAEPDQTRADHDRQIAALINQYFDRRNSGERLTPQSFVSEHTELADELAPYLEGLAILDRVRAVAAAPSAPPTDSDRAAELPQPPGYRITEELGRGGMGVVFKALQISTKRMVALKVLLAGPFASETAHQRFEREVELAARLQHSGIVRVLESGSVAGQKYYAMEYADGSRLDKYLEECPPDTRDILELFRCICVAVEHAHAHGVVHRDLKPANVIVDADGQPHILDFGLAKSIDLANEEVRITRASVAGQVVGTLPYLAPEQAAGRIDEIDQRTDVYALGVMLYEALIHQLPHDMSGGAATVAERIVQVAPRRPTTLSSRVDRELETVLLKALDKSKERRYASAGALGADLERYLKGEPVVASRPSRMYVIRKKLRKHWLAAALIAVSIVLLTGVALQRVSAERRAWRHARERVLQAQSRVEAGDALQVLGMAEAITGRFPRMPEAQLLLAQARYHGGGLFSEALRTLERGPDGGAPQWSQRALLAELYRASGRSGRADRLEAQANQVMPDTAEAWYVRSFATLDLHRARDFAREATRRDPLHVLALTRLARLCVRTDDLDGALSSAERLMDLGEERSKWLLFQANVLVRKGRFDEAISRYTQLFNMATDGSSGVSRRYICLGRAHAYRRVGEYEKAVRDYDEVIRIDKGDPGCVWDYYQRATPLWILGRREEALADYERFRVAHGRPFFADARMFIILRELDRNEEASAVLEAALQRVADPMGKAIFSCLAGRINPDTLLAAAGEDREHRCEACYYAGEYLLLADRPDEARKWFTACVNTGVTYDVDALTLTPMNEYELAQWRLETLPQPPAIEDPEKN